MSRASKCEGIVVRSKSKRLEQPIWNSFNTEYWWKVTQTPWKSKWNPRDSLRKGLLFRKGSTRHHSGALRMTKWREFSEKFIQETVVNTKWTLSSTQIIDLGCYWPTKEANAEAPLLLLRIVIEASSSKLIGPQCLACLELALDLEVLCTNSFMRPDASTKLQKNVKGGFSKDVIYSSPYHRGRRWQAPPLPLNHSNPWPSHETSSNICFGLWQEWT